MIEEAAEAFAARDAQVDIWAPRSGTEREPGEGRRWSWNMDFSPFFRKNTLEGFPGPPGGHLFGFHR